jgi:transposase
MQTQFERLTDDQWETIKHFIDWKRKRKVSLRDVFDSIFFIARTGTQWRNLKQVKWAPEWSAVYYYFEKWSKDNTLERVNRCFNILERIKVGRNPCPSLGLVDSQSVKLAPMAFEDRGKDAFKKVNGRKRHLLVDVKGRFWKVNVSAANSHDGKEGKHLLEGIKQTMQSLKKIIGDKAYRGAFADEVEKLDIEFEVPQRENGKKGFVLEARRWVVERSFAWLNFYRRLAMDFEHTTRSAQSFLMIANIKMVLLKIS